MKSQLIDVLVRYKHEFTILLGVNSVTWISSYFIPVVASITAILSLGTAILIFKREWRKNKNKT